MDEIHIINWDENLPVAFDVTDSVVKNDGEEFGVANGNATIFKVEIPVKQRTDFQVLNAGEFMKEEFPATEYLIEDMVGKFWSIVSTVGLTVPVVLFPGLSVITAVMVSAAASSNPVNASNSAAVAVAEIVPSRSLLVIVTALPRLA